MLIPTRNPNRFFVRATSKESKLFLTSIDEGLVLLPRDKELRRNQIFVFRQREEGKFVMINQKSRLTVGDQPMGKINVNLNGKKKRNSIKRPNKNH